MLKPTNINDYFNPNQHKKTSNSVWWFLGGSLLSVGAAVTIQMKPDFNIQSISRVIFSAATFGCGIGIISTAKKIDDNFYYAAKYQEAQAIVFDNAIVQHTLVQTITDDNYYSQFIPPEEQPQQQQYQQPQPEHEGQEYQDQSSYQEEEEDSEGYTPQQQGFKPNTRGIANFEVKRILEEATGIAVLGNSGSGKSCLIQLLASALPNNQILVLDPHADETDPHYAWKNLVVVNNYDDIIEQLEILLELLDNRDKTPLTIICDEWPAVRAYCKQNKIKTADLFILRYGSEARKFKKLPIFASQAGNTKAMGLEGVGDFLENFSLIRLNKIAIKYAQYLPDREVIKRLKQTAYCCLVGESPYIHPTHGHHERVFKGATPKNLTPLHSKKITIPLVASAKVLVATREPQSQPAEEPDQVDVIDVEVREVAEEFEDAKGIMPLAYPRPSSHKASELPKSIATLDDAIALVAAKLQSADSPPLTEGKTPSQIELLFKALQHHKQNQSDTIYHLFGVIKSGTSNKYKQARDLYYQLLLETADNVQEILPKLSAITFPEFRLLPAEAGIYFVFDSDFANCYYIGSSNNILFRWNSPNYGKHHRHDQVEAIAQNKAVKIGWVLTSDYERIESDLVAKFKPMWNGR